MLHRKSLIVGGLVAVALVTTSCDPKVSCSSDDATTTLANLLSESEPAISEIRIVSKDSATGNLICQATVSYGPSEEKRQVGAIIRHIDPPTLQHLAELKKVRDEVYQPAPELRNRQIQIQQIYDQAIEKIQNQRIQDRRNQNQKNLDYQDHEQQLHPRDGLVSLEAKRLQIEAERDAHRNTIEQLEHESTARQQAAQQSVTAVARQSMAAVQSQIEAEEKVHLNAARLAELQRDELFTQLTKPEASVAFTPAEWEQAKHDEKLGADCSSEFSSISQHHDNLCVGQVLVKELIPSPPRQVQYSVQATSDGNIYVTIMQKTCPYGINPMLC